MKYARARSTAAVVGLALIASLGATTAAAADPRSTHDKRVALHEQRRANPEAANVGAAGDAEFSPAAFGQFSDTTGDTDPFAACQSDIVNYSIDYSLSVLSVGLTTACSSNPHNSPNWVLGFSGMFWAFDVDNNGTEDFFVDLINVGDPNTGFDSVVFDIRGSGDPVPVCTAAPYWDGNVFYGASFSPSCIGSPGAVRMQVGARWDPEWSDENCVCAFDDAPNDLGFTTSIARTDPIPLGDGPAAASRNGGTMDVFARGADDALWTRHFDGGTWGNWTSLSGRITGTPAAASADSGELDVFVRGADNALWTNHFAGGNWSGWTSLGGVLSTPPAVVSSGQDILDVFVAGSDAALWTRHFNGSTWGPWTSRGGRINATPAAASTDVGLVDVFARGADNALWTQHFAGTWSGWSSLGGTISSAPGAASASSASVEVFARGTDNALWSAQIVDGVPGGWFSLGGTIASPPAPVSPAAGKMVVFARGTDSALWTASRPSGTWGAWTSLGGTIR